MESVNVKVASFPSELFSAHILPPLNSIIILDMYSQASALEAYIEYILVIITFLQCRPKYG